MRRPILNRAPGAALIAGLGLAGLVFIVGCGPAPTTGETPSESTASSSASDSPSAASGSPSVANSSPQPTPSEEPSDSASPEQSQSPDQTPASSATGTPSQAATASPSEPPMPQWLVETWVGHAKTATFDQDGTGWLQINDGCCTLLIKVEFKIENVTGDRAVGLVDALLTAVEIGPGFADFYGEAPAPGEKLELSVRDGIMIDSLIKAPFCDAKKQDAPGGPFCGI